MRLIVAEVRDPLKVASTVCYLALRFLMCV